MVPRITRRNVAILGLVEIGIIVAGTLAAGAVVKWQREFDLSIPQRTHFASEYGVLFLTIPTLWIISAAVILYREKDEDVSSTVCFLSGILLVLILGLVAYSCSFSVFVRLMSCSFSLSN